MPRPTLKRRIPLADELAQLDDDLRYDLEFGWSFFEGYPNWESMRNDWLKFGDEITQQWIQRHPGSRPFGWWVFTHGKERPVVLEGHRNLADRLRAGARFSFLDTSIVMGGATLQETQSDYLAQNGLLEPAEIERGKQ